MKTAKPISTISYNTETFLVGVLDSLKNARILSSWAYIKHLPDVDDKKAHIHLYMEPAKRTDTLDLEDVFNEPDPEHDKPLAVQPIRSSKFDDWYLYGLHDRDYLRAKGLTRNVFYTPDEMHFSNDDYFNQLVHLIDRLHITPYAVIEDTINDGGSFEDLIRTGRVPIPQIRSFQIAYSCLYGGSFKCQKSANKEVSDDLYTGLSFDESLFESNDLVVRDHFGRRFVKCFKCGKIAPADEFISYGGKHTLNFGLCRECSEVHNV